MSDGQDFNAHQFAAVLKRAAERESLDSIAVTNTFKLVDEIRRWVKPWGVFDEVTIKVARAIVENRLSPVRVGEIIETIVVRRRRPKADKYYIPNPGSYFVISVKREFQRAGIPWHATDRED